MDRNQQRTMESFGFAMVELPDLKTVPRMTYITPDGRELPNLPADAYHLARYLSRGFKPKLANSEPHDFVCDVCGKEFKYKIALTGHKRTHKNL